MIMFTAWKPTLSQSSSTLSMGFGWEPIYILTPAVHLVTLGFWVGDYPKWSPKFVGNVDSGLSVTSSYTCTKFTKYTPPTTTTVQPTKSPPKCPAGWYQGNVSPRKCYKFFKTEVAWTKALGHCKSFGGSLVSIDSAFENAEFFCKSLVLGNILYFSCFLERLYRWLLFFMAWLLLLHKYQWLGLGQWRY
jgi:hypothetical protein